MLVVLSPAKKMRSDVEAKALPASQPLFQDEAVLLTQKLSKFTKPKLMKLMSISQSLAELNLDRYKTFESSPSDDRTESAIHAFNGDVYLGIESATLSKKQLSFANKHVRILSGLYGYLRPADQIQPYRLEMGSRLPIKRKKNLYEFWGEQVAEAINSDFKRLKSNVIINLASKEYFKAVDEKRLDAKIVTIHFREYRDGVLKAIQFNLKRARGLMTRYIVEHELTQLNDIKGFDIDGYTFESDMSDDLNYYFVR